jgi:hypothetical protein
MGSFIRGGKSVGYNFSSLLLISNIGLGTLKNHLTEIQEQGNIYYTLEDKLNNLYSSRIF